MCAGCRAGISRDPRLRDHEGTRHPAHRGAAWQFLPARGRAKPVILLAGGTGFAPIKAIIEHAFHRQSLRPMTLYWGARDRAGLYLHELAEGWAAGRAGFDYVPVLSEPAAGDGWPGRTGLVHRAVMADFPDLSGHRVYACGAPAMIEAARSDLIGGCGLKEEDFFADSFTFATDSTRP
jgi:CDP-4-dehydro-6-deoxyglucose reductase